MKIKNRILWITQTALFLGLTVATQYYLTTLLGGPGNPVSQLAVGSLVNMFLILATVMCGFFSGLSLAVITPFISFAIGKMPHVWIIPFVALGNTVIVFIFWLVCGKKIFGQNFSLNWAVAAISGAIFKFGVLWLGVTQIFVKFILPNDAALKAPQIAKMTSVISFNYSFPQLATALTGSILVYVIYPVLEKAVTGKKADINNLKN